MDFRIFFSPVPTGETTYLGWLLAGLRTTIALSLSSWILALALGTILGILRTVPNRALRAMSGTYVEVFRKQRKVLAPMQGEERSTWVQTVLIGDVAVVGVPAEYFTVLGQDIKRRSPFRYTYVAELANDWIGYLPDKKAHELGGYQTWTGLHSYAEVGTGERVADAAVGLLEELAKAN